MGAYRVFKAGSVPHHGMENLPKPDFAGIRTRAWRAIYPTQAKGRLEWGTQALLPLIQEIRERHVRSPK